MLILPLLVSILTAAEVSITPPKWYQGVMEPQLSAMDEIDLEPGKDLIEDEAGMILLSEAIYRIRPNVVKDAD